MRDCPGEENVYRRFDSTSHRPRTVGNAALALAFLIAAPVAGQPPLNRVMDTLRREVPAGVSLALRSVELDGGELVDLELERFEVFAPGAVVVHRDDDGEHLLPPPRDRYFRGTVAGRADSFAFLAVGRTARGFIATDDTWFAIAPLGGAYGSEQDAPSFARRFDPDLDRPPDSATWSCANDTVLPPPPSALQSLAAAPVAPASSTVYAATLALETDYELYQKFGSTEALVTYVADLVAASSAIYRRDVKTVLQIGTLYTYATAQDPWSATTMDGALFELGDYWHANRAGVSRSTVHLLSGKRLGGGIAWVGVICDSDFPYGGHWGGGYGVSANLNGAFSTTNPSLYWDILCFSHELGHNFNSEHTHCYRPPVDTCYSGESGCYSGPVSVPPEQGTIMSYCHLRSGGYNNIKLYFGVVGEPSEPVLNVIRSYVESRATCLAAASDAPTLTAVSPTSGSTSGRTVVTVTGTNFAPGAAVAFGGSQATDVVVVSPTTITARTPPHAAGAVDVAVTNPDGQSGALANGFTYTACDTEVSNRTITEAEEITSPCAVVAGPSVRVAAGGGGVRFLAGTFIALRNGFSVATAARFAAGVTGTP